MKVAILNDTHAGIRNSSDIFIEYQEKFYNEVFFPYLLENNIKNIIHLGDYYEHRRFINFKALNANRQHFLDKLREYGITMDIIPGNHDCYFKNTNDLNALKELLGHYMNEVNIIMRPTVIEYGSLKIGLVPWIAPDVEDETNTFLKNCDADVIGGHFELQGFDMMKGMPCVHGMHPSALDRFELVLSGHFHTKSNRGNIHYLGSQMEFFWNDADDPKYFHVIDTEERELIAVRNPHKLFQKIYYDDTKEDYMSHDVSYVENKFVKVIVLNKSKPVAYECFLDRIQSRAIHELKIQEDFTEFEGENVSDDDVEIQDTQSLLSTYIEAVETTLDKNVLKGKMLDLMKEAQTMDFV